MTETSVTGNDQEKKTPPHKKKKKEFKFECKDLKYAGDIIGAGKINIQYLTRISTVCYCLSS